MAHILNTELWREQGAISETANKEDPCSWQSSFNEMLFMQKDCKCGHEVSLSSQYKIPPPGVLACIRMHMTVRSFTSTSPPNILSPLPPVDCAAVCRDFTAHYTDPFDSHSSYVRSENCHQIWHFADVISLRYQMTFWCKSPSLS